MSACGLPLLRHWCIYLMHHWHQQYLSNLDKQPHPQKVSVLLIK